ncbi:Hypothetical protein PBC10988_23100 [Planctomycetales bacterium 10988]|nr:Hypothetical protein PBC10988_23100 [Planctomycetales bacterium 10988]
MSETKKYLSREEILNADDILREEVDVPEWGGTVILQSLTEDELNNYEEEGIKKNGRHYQSNLERLRSRLISRCAISPEGLPIFSAKDVQHLAKKSALAMNRLFDVASRMNGMTKSDLEELAKNSVNGPVDDSSSDSL